MLAKLFYTGPSLHTLHEEYAKQSRIDEAAQLTSESSVIIDAPVSQVWAVVSDAASWPAWFSRDGRVRRQLHRPAAAAGELPVPDEPAGAQAVPETQHRGAPHRWAPSVNPGCDGLVDHW